MPRKQTKKPKIYKVYIVYSPSRGLYYVGHSSKSGVPYDNYYGSGNYTDEWEDKVKVTLAEYTKVSWAKFLELQLQIDYRLDDRCVNAMFQFRCNGNHLKEWDDQGAFLSMLSIVNKLGTVGMDSKHDGKEIDNGKQEETTVTPGTSEKEET